MNHYRYIALFDDRFGRALHALTNDPVELLARRIAEEQMTVKVAGNARVYEVAACDVDLGRLTERAKRLSYLQLVRSNRLVVLDALAKRTMSNDDLEVLRRELQIVFPLGTWNPPWPRIEED